MHILLITDSYPPEIRSAAELMKDLAQGLKEKGHEVSVVTSYPRYNLGSAIQQFPNVLNENGVRVIRVKTAPHHKVNFIIRGIAQLLLPYLFFRAARRYVEEKVDVIIVHSPPLPLSITAQKIKKEYGAKYILNLHDIFPQNAIDLGILTIRPAIKLFERMERRAYATADTIVTPSREHKMFLEKNRNIASNKIEVINHWINAEPYKNVVRTNRFRKEYGLENKFIFLFAGVLGPAQGLDLIIRIAERVRNIPEIVFVFAGEGTAKSSLEKLTQSKNLSNVIFKPFVPTNEYPELVKDADVGVICLSSKNTTPAVPAKVVGYMAAGIPVVAFVHEESDIHQIVKDARCGYTAISDDEERAVAIVKALYGEKDKLREYGENAFAYMLNNFEKHVCIDKFEKVLKQ